VGYAVFILQLHRRGVYCFTSVLLSIQDIFRRVFLSNYRWQKSDIWSQTSDRYAILWEAFLDPSDSSFLFADLVMLTYDTPVYMFNVYRNQLSQQTGSRNLTGPKMLPTIWHTYLKFVTKYQISAIDSCWEKRVEKYLAYFLFADLVGFYIHWTYIRGYHKWALALSSSCFY
jgi:hypothetical protein